MESSSSVVSFMMNTIPTFILPVAIVCVICSFLSNIIVDYKTEKFADTCRATGQITPNNFNDFAQSIGKYGKFSIEIMHETDNYYSQDGEEPVQVRTAKVTSDILDYIYPEEIYLDNRIYEMHNGDTLTVTVKKQSSFFTSITSTVPMTITQSGGYVKIVE